MKTFRFKEIIGSRFWLFLAFLALGVVSLSLFYNTWTHTLNKNGNWTSTKTGLHKGVMGAWSFMLTHRALAHNHLDPGAWHGHQEVFCRHSPRAGKIAADINLTDRAWVLCYFARTGDTLHAVRISLDPAHPSAYLAIVNGEFIQKLPVPIPTFPPGWNRFAFSTSDAFLQIELNGEPLPAIGLPCPVEVNTAGFRGCERPVLIDNIRFHDAGNRLVFEETFRMPLTRIVECLLLFLAGVMLYLLVGRLRKTLMVLTVNMSIIMFLVLLFYLFYGQHLYPKEWMIHWGAKTTTIETKEQVDEKMPGAFRNAANDDTFTIMFLGSSQTWGAGATLEAMTFTSRLEKMLNDSVPGPVRCINTGISGISSDQVLKHYREDWIRSHPDVCIVNLSVNDAGNPHFKDNLRQVIGLNNDASIQTVFIPEPVSATFEGHAANQEIMRKLAEEYGIPLIEMQDHLQTHGDDGLLYWDFVHLTDFGQALFALKLFPFLKASAITRIRNVNQTSK